MISEKKTSESEQSIFDCPFAGVYILPFCAFYYSVIFSALQLFTELFSIGYSKFFVYLHPTPLLNAKLVRFGLLLTKNHYFL